MRINIPKSSEDVGRINLLWRIAYETFECDSEDIKEESRVCSVVGVDIWSLLKIFINLPGVNEVAILVGC